MKIRDNIFLYLVITIQRKIKIITNICIRHQSKHSLYSKDADNTGFDKFYHREVKIPTAWSATFTSALWDILVFFLGLCLLENVPSRGISFYIPETLKAILIYQAQSIKAKDNFTWKSQIGVFPLLFPLPSFCIFCTDF